MNFAKGFTLVELAMVLFIVSLLLGGLLVPLATQLEGRQRNEAQLQLEVIVEALQGFAIINGRLPCYTTQSDPANVNYGEEDSPCNPAGLSADGYLPWKTLGLDEMDPWGIRRTASTDPWLGYWRYRVDAKFYSTFTLSTDASTSPGSGLRVDELDFTNSIVGTPAYNRLTSSSEPPIVIVYSTGANMTVDGNNATYEKLITDNPIYESGSINNLDRDGDGDQDEFDDITVWLARPLLFSRMVKASRLP